MGICDMYIDQNKILKVLAKLDEEIYFPNIIYIT